MDLLYDQEAYVTFKDKLEGEGYEVFPISAATGDGLDALLNRVTSLLDTVEVEALIDESDYFVETIDTSNGKDIKFFMDGDVYCVEGDYIDRLLYSTNLEDIESLRRFQNALKVSGVFDTLRKMGIEDGDTVRIFELEFEFYD